MRAPCDRTRRRASSAGSRRAGPCVPPCVGGLRVQGGLCGASSGFGSEEVLRLASGASPLASPSPPRHHPWTGAATAVSRFLQALPSGRLRGGPPLPHVPAASALPQAPREMAPARSGLQGLWSVSAGKDGQATAQGQIRTKPRIALRADRSSERIALQGGWLSGADRSRSGVLPRILLYTHGLPGQALEKAVPVLSMSLPSYT